MATPTFSQERLIRVFFPVIGALLLGGAGALAQIQRVPNTTLALPQKPPVYGYTATNAFGTLTFTNPVAIVTPPGETNRLFVVEQGGRIALITNLANPTRTTFLDVSSRILGGVPSDERGLLGLAFHPGYGTNGAFFIFYTGNYTTPGVATNQLHDILARYQVSPSNSNAALTTETILFAQYDEAFNHNGGDLHFGPDGFLYVALGDEGGGNDTYNNSQRIDKDFFSGIVRLDVDKRFGNLLPNPHPALQGATNYLVPSDNPFIGATHFNGLPVNPTNVRTEFWAVGLRNPWRISFDRATGRLYCGDVGQGAREEIDVITRGGNYGWNYREGFIARPGSGAPPGGFSGIDPILDYTRGTATNQGFAVMGGVVYRGTKISQLSGAYIFADNGSGHVWNTRYDGTNTTPFTWMFTETGISAFGIDPRNGDVLMANLNSDRIRRLIYSTNVTGAPLPQTLAAVGAFSNMTTLSPHTGIVPYDVNVPFWSDGALKSRWFSIPDTNQTIGFARESNWSFPTGALWMKHFEIELTNGVASSRRRLETRFIVKNADGIYGVTYRWGTSITNATLVPEEGMDEDLVISDGGNLRTQVWHYPSRAECLSCHTAAGGWAIGFNTPQLNREFDDGGGAENQIRALSLAGYFNTNVTGIHTLRALAHPTNSAVSAEYRVRSYLAANCAHCHQPGGSALGFWDARITTPSMDAGLINGPLIDNRGDTNNAVFKPGSLSNSILLVRISSPGPDRMPPLDSSVVDTQAVQLVSAWITNDLPGYRTFAQWQSAFFGATNSAPSAADADADGDGANNYLEYIAGTNPTNVISTWRMSVAVSNETAQLIFPRILNRTFEAQSSDHLFGDWTALDVPGNEPFFSATNQAGITEDLLTPTNRFYRIRISAP